MNYTKECGTFPSSNGIDDVAYYIYKPLCEPKAVVQIVHGMCEYCGRYEDFISFLCANGITVCCHDQLGHGTTAGNEEKLGFFAEERGWQFLAKDTVHMSKIMKAQDHRIPFYIIGHSMGSLVVRTVLAKFDFLYSGAVLLGTLNTKVGTDAGIVLTRSLSKIKGSHYRSKAVDELIFGLNNRKIEEPASEYSWISRDEEIVSAYENDPLCNFHFTMRAYSDLLFLVSYVSDKNWAKKLEKDLPVLICSGTDDPIGNYGKGPQEVFDVLNAEGFDDLELKLYSGARHELLNETNRAEVYEDILSWLNSHIDGIERND